VRHVKTPLISSTGSWIKGHARMHSIVALLVFVIGLAATFYYWNNLKENVEQDRDVAFGRSVQAISNSASARIQLYETFLRGNSSLFVVKDYIGQPDWDRYHRSYDIKERYPDIQGIGLSRYLTKSEVPGYLGWKASQGESDFTIFPAGDREVYVPVVLNTPFTGNNGKAKGYDGFTEPTRRAAMERAAGTGRPAISGKIELVSESRPARSSFILYMPIYEKELPAQVTAAERWEALLGFSYMAIDAATFIDAVLENAQSPHVALEMHDAILDQDSLLYRSANFRAITGQKGSKVESSTLEAYGHQWRITLVASPEIISSYERQLPLQAVWRGLLSSLLFAGLVWYLITDRERKYARQKHEEVQTAKDDLLSLASHQLRTPATVVKQYVGMLLQGYAGDLTKQQKDMLGSAYESNERQLDIINQLLYVARLDAGRLKLHKEKTDISKMLHDVARDHSGAAEERNQKISFKLPKRPVWAAVDPHYMRMVFENLLSNAIKYTPSNGHLTLAVRRTPAHVTVRVSDTGVGVDPALLDSIFEKFTRVENELSTDVNGSGVGLYLTKKIVELHKGSIDVHSIPGQGSSFTVRIPSPYVKKTPRT
jgi:two-component system, sensor histidine kinase